MSIGKKTKIATTMIGLLAIATTALILVLDSAFEGKAWQKVPPEKLGFDSDTFSEMLADIEANDQKIHGILVMREEQIAFEQYFPPYKEDTLHSFKSVSKSITSILAGIAISEGKLSLDTTVYEVFPEAFEGVEDPRKKTITVRHLLTMTPGFAVTDEDPEVEEYTSEDWIKKYMQHPLKDNPGEKFSYFSPTTNLLTAILTEKIERDLGEYAQEKLFIPLGIEDIYWARGSLGYLRGGSGIYSTPREMAKIGLLYLNDGKYEEKQIVDKNWVRESTKNQIGDNTFADYQGMQDSKYGYQWWLPDSDHFMALGWGGQTIFVVPDLKMVVVKTGGDDFESNLSERYIFPALKSYFWPLPEAPEKYQKLQSLSESLQNPAPSQDFFMPELARSIDDQEYICDDGNELVKFETNQPEGDVDRSEEFSIYRTYKLPDGQDHTLTIPVGLDGLYRHSKVNSHYLPIEEEFNDLETVTVSTIGEWQDKKTLLVETQILGLPLYEEWQFRFDDENRMNWDIAFKPVGPKYSLKCTGRFASDRPFEGTNSQ